MKKITWATHKSLFSQIASSSCLLAVSAGIVFGVSAGTFKIEYLNLNDAEARLKAALEHNYYSQNIKSQWNMYQKDKPGDEGYIKEVAQPTSKEIDQTWWETVHPGTTRFDQAYNNIDPNKMELSTAEGTSISETAQKERAKYSALVIDGATHTALDRSFNQGLYNGLANFNTNIQHDVVDNSEGQVFKPSQDSTQEFINIYRAVAANSRVLALAGFNHVTPLNALGKRNADGIFEFADKNIANAGMMLMDGDIANNQNVASVLFRSDQPAFLTALATCIYFYNNLDLYHNNFQDISVAAYGGTAIPTVTIYMGGFQRGIEFFNEFVLRERMLKLDGAIYIENTGTQTPRSDYFEKKLLPASKYKADVEALRNSPQQQKGTQEFKDKKDQLLNKMYDEYSIKMIKLGDFMTHFSGSFSAGDAIGISKQYLNRGASAIIAVAGPQSLDTAQEIMNQNKNCIVIGVDSAMERSDYQKPFKNANFKDKTVAASGDKTISAQASNIIKFSAVKDMTNVSNKILRLAATGKNWDNNSVNPWVSASSIPTWTADEEVSFDDLAIDWNDEKLTYNVTGFKTSVSLTEKQHVLNIPVKHEHNGKTYKLDTIAGFDISSTSGEALANIDTLKISGTLDAGESIKFGSNASGTPVHAFDYENWIGFGTKPGIKYVDLTDIPCDRFDFDTNTYVFNCMSWNDSGQIECNAYNNGIVKFYVPDTNLDKKSLFTRIFKNVVGPETSGQKDLEWANIEPDPYSSICSFGFKTCGNIENGLISISWDGWPYLLEAFRHCDFVYGSGSPISFEDIWINLCQEYADTHGEETLGKTFYQFLKTTTTLDGYSTFDKESPLNKNYSHVMTILGEVLNNCKATFPANMTVLFDKDQNPYLPTISTALSILDWLRFNMYFTL